MKTTIVLLLLAATLLLAQEPSTEGYLYEERPGVGLIYEFSTIEDIVYEYTVAKQPFDLKTSNGPLLGVGANMPIGMYMGLNGVVGFQTLEWEYNIRDNAVRDAILASDTTRLTADDFNGELKSLNLLVQAGFEMGLPVYTDYNSQFMVKILGYGSGIAGKTFFDETKFQQANLWGYAYGAAVRMAYGPISLNGGLRNSYVYWRTYFDPEEMTGLQAMDDNFMFEYKTFLTPYVKATWALY